MWIAISVLLLFGVSFNWALFALFGESRIANEFVKGNSQWLLKYLIMMVIHLFQFENYINFVYFSYIGGHKLIIHLSNIAVLNNDNDNKLGLKIIYATLATIICVNIFTLMLDVFGGYLSFFQGLLRVFFSFFFQVIYVSTQYQAGIFYYCMITYKRQIQQFQTRYFKSSKCLFVC